METSGERALWAQGTAPGKGHEVSLVGLLCSKSSKKNYVAGMEQEPRRVIEDTG